MFSKREIFLKGLQERWQEQYRSHPMTSTKENGPFSVVSVVGEIPLHSEPLFHRLQTSWCISVEIRAYLSLLLRDIILL